MTIHDPSLRAALKTLKLTGMLDTLDARLAQTRDGQLGHLEFLQVLCEDEIARRETAALARRLRRARFEQPATFEDFDFTANPKLPAAMLRDLAALRWLDAGESVILYGPVGVGKTPVAQAWHKRLVIMSPAVVGTCGSSSAPACLPISPVAMPIARSVSGCENTPGRWC